jgi:hypothetical protein
MTDQIAPAPVSMTRAGRTAGPPRRPGPGQLEAGHVRRLQTLGTAYDFKFDGLTFVERFVAFRLNGRKVYENIFPALPLYESITLAGVEPLHRSLFFHKTSSNPKLFDASPARLEATKKAASANLQPLISESKAIRERQTPGEYTTADSRCSTNHKQVPIAPYSE